MPEIVIIVAVAKNRVIGKDDELIWNGLIAVVKPSLDY
jgi:hypothetical protein